MSSSYFHISTERNYDNGRWGAGKKERKADNNVAQLGKGGGVCGDEVSINKKNVEEKEICK